MKKAGSLTVVGTGMTVAGQLTAEAETHIKNAEVLFGAMPTQISFQWLLSLNAEAQSLGGFYQDGKSRRQSYREMTDTVLAAVRTGKNVVAAFYGHPGVFVTPSHQMIHQAREEGFKARMLPGVSAEDCLFADLGFDPAESGCQSYEAMDFLMRNRVHDPSAALILWQIGNVGDYGFDRTAEKDPKWLKALVEKLSLHFSEDHEVVLYEASMLPVWPCRADTIRLGDLPSAELSRITTLYVPPLKRRQYDPDLLARMGISAEDIG